MFPNKYPGSCACCGARVQESKGFAFKGALGWACACASTACLARLVLNGAAAATPAGRRLPPGGRIEIPFERAATPLLRAMPGAGFDGGTKAWSVSLAMSDRPRVLE